MHLLPTFTVQNFEKHTLELIQSYKDTSFLGPELLSDPTKNFFWKSSNIVLI